MYLISDISYYLYGIINHINVINMPKFNFETRANNRLKEIIAQKSSEKAENILATPFVIDPEYVDKHITLSIKENSKVKDFNSTSKQVKLGNYCICMQTIADVAPIWYNKNPYSLLLVNYIIGKIQLYGNFVELTEKDFISWSGASRDSFYRALNALLRPTCPNPCAGDNIALLAATTRKSIYIVNHNFIFRGNYDEFITLYELKYPNGCKLDSRGRVIIER